MPRQRQRCWRIFSHFQLKVLPLAAAGFHYALALPLSCPLMPADITIYFHIVQPLPLAILPLILYDIALPHYCFRHIDISWYWYITFSLHNINRHITYYWYCIYITYIWLPHYIDIDTLPLVITPYADIDAILPIFITLIFRHTPHITLIDGHWHW
jgi:hypothetical protein